MLKHDLMPSDLRTGATNLGDERSEAMRLRRRVLGILTGIFSFLSPHAGMVDGREHERNIRLLNALLYALRRQVYLDPERLKDVCGATRAGDRPVARLRHDATSRRRKDNAASF